MDMSKNMDEIVTMVGGGLQSVEAVGTAFQNIVGEIQAAAEQSESMTATSEEMAAGNQVVTDSMRRLAYMWLFYRRQQAPYSLPRQVPEKQPECHFRSLMSRGWQDGKS